MGVATRFNLTAGLHSGPGEATKDHCVSAINVFSDQSRLKKRRGSKSIRAITGPKTTQYVGWATTTAEPGAVANAGTSTAGAGNNTLYQGASTKWYRGRTYGASISTTVYPLVFLSGLVIEYWNGTSWVTDPSCGWLWKPKYSAANDNHTATPYITYDPASAGAITDAHVDIVGKHPSDWSAKTIAGQNLFWRRIRFPGANLS